MSGYKRIYPKKKTRRDFIKESALGIASLTAGIGFPKLYRAGGNKSPSYNLLFIMTDQQSFDTLSRAGNKVSHTPHLDRLANEGVYFEKAFSNNPECVPARAVILTGHSSGSLGVQGNSDYNSPDVADVPSFDNILSSRGYHTEYHGKWHTPYKYALTYDNYVRQIGEHAPVGEVSQKDAYLQYLHRYFPRRPAGKNELIDSYSQRPYVPDPMDWSYGLPPEKLASHPDDSGRYGNLDIPFNRTRTAFVAEDILEALDHMKQGPFSLTCSFSPPHPPRVLPEPYYGMYPPRYCDPPMSIDDPMENSPYAAVASKNNMLHYRDKGRVRYMISDYYGMIRDVDDWVGKILNKLERLGLKSQTLVIFTSDHGEMLGSHGMYGKLVFYEESVHIPLIMRLPGIIPPGSIVAHPVSHIDLFATILDYLGVKGHKSEGNSLRPLIEGRVYTGPDFCVSERINKRGPNYMIRTAECKFMFANSPKSKALDALYNLKDDPHEMNNLMGNNLQRGEYLDQAEEMKERLVSWLKSINSPHLQGVIDRPITHDKPPVVSIVTPKNDSVVSKSLTVNAEVCNEIGIREVRFYLNDEVRKTASVPPYVWEWNTKYDSNGSYTLKVKAWDRIDQTGEDVIKVTINNEKKSQQKR